ncbi:MAG: hypothetical protein H8D78_06345 [Chloroflexi bacterium]|nr:hypothetical protein [Chloroflexota bacterium]
MSGYGEYAWGKRNCQVYGGSYSGWAVGGGRDGQSLACGSDYPDNVQSWMVYGPFSLADATAADLSFKVRVYAEAEHDWFFWGASTDGNSFRGPKAWGDSQGWREEGLDLTDAPGLGDLTGRPRVWIALIFSSNSSTHFAEGVHVDNIVLRKYVPGTGATAAEPSARQPVAGPDTLIVVPEKALRHALTSPC